MNDVNGINNKPPFHRTILKIAVGRLENIRKSFHNRFVFHLKQHRIAKHHSDNMELISQKGENHETHEGFIYRLDRILSNGAESWRCVEKKGRGQIHVMKNDIHITGNHYHVPNLAKIEMKLSLSEVRRRSFQLRDIPRIIIQETHATLREEAVAELPSYTSVQRMIQRKRKRDNVLIPNPAR